MKRTERIIKNFLEDYGCALVELQNGYKETHWMWWIFPQVSGLGYSYTAQFFAIESIEQAQEFINRPDIRRKYHELCNILLSLPTNDAGQIFGYPDDLKLKSSLTLFSMVDNCDIYEKVLNKYFGSERCEFTINTINEWRKNNG